ncbi:MAG: protein argonaute [Acidimicrobiales bacterium]
MSGVPNDAARSAVRLNGFRVNYSVAEFEVFVRPGGSTFDLAAERAAHETEWRLFANRGEILALCRHPGAAVPPGEVVRRQVADSFSLFQWLVDEALPDAFSAYEPLRLHPFTFVGTQRDFVSEVAAELKMSGEALEGFTIRPRYRLHTRVVALRGTDAFVGLFVDVGTRWEIDRDLTDLVAAGVDIRGMYAVRREPNPGERRLVGRIDRIDAGTAHLSDNFDGPTEVSTADLRLEGSRQSFARCLQALLKSGYERFEDVRAKRANGWFSPDSVVKEFDRLGEFVARHPLHLAEGIDASIGERIDIAKHGRPPNLTSVPPVQYCFDAARTKQDRSSWSGLSRFGPFSRDSFPKKSPKILVVFPDMLQGRVETFLRALRDGVAGASPSGYGAGLANTFSLVHPEFPTLPVPWSGPGRPVDRYRTAIESLLATPGETPDAALVVLRDEDARLPDLENPYLHSKALLLVAGVPTQEVRQSTIGDARGLQYTLRNIAIALYAKLGGTPWTVNQDLTISDEVVVGVGVCELGESRFAERQRYVGVTTVFRGDGNYLLGSLSRECDFHEYPEVLRQSTTGVLEEIKRRNGWEPGDTVRVVCHAHRPLRDIDTARIMADCVAAVGGDQTVEFAFLTVSQDHPFQLIDPQQQGLKNGKGKLVPERGIVVNLSAKARLLTVTGPSLLRTDPAPLPHPLQVTLHRSSTFKDLDYLTEQVLKFTALSWRSVLPSNQPVTILYSELIAELLGRLRAVREWSPAPLNTSLRASRWFL